MTTNPIEKRLDAAELAEGGLYLDMKREGSAMFHDDVCEIKIPTTVGVYRYKRTCRPDEAYPDFEARVLAELAPHAPSVDVLSRTEFEEIAARLEDEILSPKMTAQERAEFKESVRELEAEQKKRQKP